MISEDSENEHQQRGILSTLLHLWLRLWEFWETTELFLSVLASLFLAVGFCLMPLTCVSHS